MKGGGAAPAGLLETPPPLVPPSEDPSAEAALAAARFDPASQRQARTHAVGGSVEPGAAPARAPICPRPGPAHSHSYPARAVLGSTRPGSRGPPGPCRGPGPALLRSEDDANASSPSRLGAGSRPVRFGRSAGRGRGAARILRRRPSSRPAGRAAAGGWVRRIRAGPGARRSGRARPLGPAVRLSAARISCRERRRQHASRGGGAGSRRRGLGGEGADPSKERRQQHT